MTTEPTRAAERDHIRQFFFGHELATCRLPAGPVHSVLPHLEVLRVSPGPHTFGLWLYATLGACAVPNPAGTGGLEFFLLVQDSSQAHADFLAKAAYYHHGHCLGVGHTYPIGEPFAPGSSCDHILVSLPYPFGPDFEHCPVPNGHVHYLWLLPITASERAFKASQGLEALEVLFENSAFRYYDPLRLSVV